MRDIETTLEMIDKVGNIDWLKKNCLKLHYFGLGFIQLKLSPTQRVHFYTSKLEPIVPEEDIHDHRYPFISYILGGLLNQRTYSKIPGNTHILEYESCREGQSSEFIEECGFQPLNFSTYSKDSIYTIHEDTFHNVFAKQAITFIYRPPFYVKDKARVAHVKNKEKVCPFSKKVSEEELWDIIREEILCIKT